MFSLWLITYSPWLSQDPRILPNGVWIRGHSGWGTGAVLVPVCTVSSNPFRWFFPGFAYMGCSVLCWAFEGSLCRSLGFLFCVTLSLPVLGPVNSRPLQSPWLSAHFLSSQRLLGSIQVSFSVAQSLKVVWGCHPQVYLFVISLLFLHTQCL